MNTLLKSTQTALVTAYKRAQTEIDFSAAIKTGLEEIPQINEFFKQASIEPLDSKTAELALRDHALNRRIVDFGPSSIIELGAGFSARGLIFSSKGFRVIEVDLAQVIELKRLLLAKSVFDRVAKPTLLIGDVLLPETWERIQGLSLGPRPIVVAEGLMRYLDFSAKRKLAETVRAMLLAQGGAWVTCDLTLKSMLHSEQDIGNPGLANAVVDSNLNNAFENIEHALGFFRALGFAVSHTGADSSSIEKQVCFSSLDRSALEVGAKFVNVLLLSAAGPD